MVIVLILIRCYQWCKIMFTANGDIGLVSTDLDLLSIIDRFTCLGTQDHGCLAGTVLADGFDLLDLVG